MKRDDSQATLPSAWKNPDQFIEANFISARSRIEHTVKDATAYAQLYPEKALLWAVGSGYLLRVLPLTGILRALIRILLSLLKPAALIYGAAKFWQKAQLFAPGRVSKNR